MKKMTYQPEGNYYDKYSSKNPIERRLMNGFFSSLRKMLESTVCSKEESNFLEAGCGEGHVTEFVKEWLTTNDINMKMFAFDISSTLIEENIKNNQDIYYFCHSIYEPIPVEILPEKGRFTCIICSEVFEHLEKPEEAVRNLMNYADKFIVSVPHEPIWRIMNMCRGKYWLDFGNTPGHIQHFSTKSFRKMLSRSGLNILQMEKPLPWLMAYCEKDRTL